MKTIHLLGLACLAASFAPSYAFSFPGFFASTPKGTLSPDAGMLVRMEVQDDIQGQDEAVGSLTNTIQLWLRQPAERRQLLSMVIAGATGTGKSTFAKAVSRGLFVNKNGHTRDGDGLLFLASADYTSDTNAAAAKLRRTIAAHARTCSTSFVVLDEAAKASTKVMKEYARIVKEGRVKDGDGFINLHNSLFLLITDLQLKDVTKMLRKVARDHGRKNWKYVQHQTAGSIFSRHSAFHRPFTKSLRDALKHQWPGAKLDHLATSVTAFLPLGKAQIEQIVKQRLIQMDEVQVRADSIEPLAELLAGDNYVPYDLVRIDPDNEESSVIYKLSEYGGRVLDQADSSLGRLQAFLLGARRSAQQRTGDWKTTSPYKKGGYISKNDRVSWRVGVRPTADGGYQEAIEECVGRECVIIHRGELPN